LTRDPVEPCTYNLIGIVAFDDRAILRVNDLFISLD
jgi:hypothetical protein